MKRTKKPKEVDRCTHGVVIPDDREDRWIGCEPCDTENAAWGIGRVMHEIGEALWAGRSAEWIEELRAGLGTPEGFTKVLGEEKWREEPPFPTVTLTGDGIEIKAVFHPGSTYEMASGHTSFDTVHGRRTFDAHGVSDSFYLSPWATVAEADEIVTAEIAKCRKSRGRIATSVVMPNYGYLFTAESLEEARKTLRAGKTLTRAPAGFGTGHYFRKSRGKFGHAYSTPAPASVVEFFGVGPIWVETFDHD
jgi:hypothetical protein